MPLLLTLVFTLAVLWARLPVNYFGESGLLERLLAFVQTLVGFFIAALAAVASFNSPHLDKTMPDEPPTMVIRYNKGTERVKATRRRFLSAMFAYLTAVGFLFSVAAIVVLTVGPAVASVLPSLVMTPMKFFVAFGFTFAITQLVCVTFWGLYYLGERVHTPD